MAVQMKPHKCGMPINKMSKAPTKNSGTYNYKKLNHEVYRDEDGYRHCKAETYNPELSYLNEEFFPEGVNNLQEFNEWCTNQIDDFSEIRILTREEKNRKTGKVEKNTRHRKLNTNAATMLCGIIKPNGEEFGKLDLEDQKAYLQDALEITNEILQEISGGLCNINAFALHMDEAIPHIHYQAMSWCYNKYGEVDLNGSFIGNKLNGMLNRVFPAKMQERGWNVIPTDHYHKNLPDNYEELSDAEKKLARERAGRLAKEERIEEGTWRDRVNLSQPEYNRMKQRDREYEHNLKVAFNRQKGADKKFAEAEKALAGMLEMQVKAANYEAEALKLKKSVEDKEREIEEREKELNEQSKKTKENRIKNKKDAHLLHSKERSVEEQVQELEEQRKSLSEQRKELKGLEEKLEFKKNELQEMDRWMKRTTKLNNTDLGMSIWDYYHEYLNSDATRNEINAAYLEFEQMTEDEKEELAQEAYLQASDANKRLGYENFSKYFKTAYPFITYLQNKMEEKGVDTPDTDDTVKALNGFSAWLDEDAIFFGLTITKHKVQQIRSIFETFKYNFDKAFHKVYGEVFKEEKAKLAAKDAEDKQTDAVENEQVKEAPEEKRLDANDYVPANLRNYKSGVEHVQERPIK